MHTQGADGDEVMLLVDVAAVAEETEVEVVTLLAHEAVCFDGLAFAVSA